MATTPTFRVREGDVILFQLESPREFCKRYQSLIKKKQDLIKQEAAGTLKAEQRWADQERVATQEILRERYNRTNLDYYIKICLHLARCYEVQGDINNAITVLESVLTDASKYLDIYVQLMSLYEYQREYPKAKEMYEKAVKERPAICLRQLPPPYSAPYSTFLVCGLSTQLQHYEEDFDEIVDPDKDGDCHYLLKKSVIRLGLLATVQKTDIRGQLGSISDKRHKRLLEKLREYLGMPLREYLGMP